MDKRVLTLGKYNKKINYESFSKREEMLTECYFSWINLVKIPENTDQFTSNKIFSHKLINDNFLYLTSESKHIQESMILVSDIEDDFLDFPSVVYISMINIPMWTESAFMDYQDYLSARRQIFDRINKIIDESCKLYHTFDHCDLILLADGKKISLPDYIKKLKKIREIVINTNNRESCIKAILDITTIYGYTNEAMKNQPCVNGQISFVLELSFKTLECKDKLLDFVESQPDFVIETVGRYDTMMFWKAKAVPVFEKIIRFLHNNFDDFFAYKIILGSEIAEEKKDCGIHSEAVSLANDSQLLSVAVKKFESEEKIKNCLYGDSVPLYNAIIEIQNSIRTMLGNGFALYYTLSFYESFYSFIDYILRLFDNVKGLNAQKIALERTYELFKAYFDYLNALNACTIHTERQFLQTDSYQLLYFDAAPKIIAFYTAVANKIVSVIENDSMNNYTFLITPDFKKDIFVESITNDHTLDKELNILIIHVDEHSLYDIPTTLKIITHEIFHHIGQSKKLRIKRACFFVKCFVAYIFSNCIPREIFNLSNSLDSYKLFKEIVDAFFSRFIVNEDSDNDAKIFKYRQIEDMKHDETRYTFAQEVHYYMYLINSFINDINILFTNISYTDVKEILSGIIDKPLKQYFNILPCNNDGVEYSIITDFSNSYIAENLYSNIHNWLAVNSNFEEYRAIRDAFREGFADVCMINLFFKDDNVKTEEYLKMIFNGILAKEEDLRIYSVVETLRKDDEYSPSAQEIIKKFKKSMIENKNNINLGSENGKVEISEIYTDINTLDELVNLYEEDIFLENKKIEERFEVFKRENYSLFSCYLIEMVSEYLRNCNKEISQISNIDELREDLIDMVGKFNDGSVQNVVDIMDKEIYEYRLRLIASENLAK